MARHSIARATSRSDFIVAIEWSDGSKSVVDFRPDIAKDEALSYLREPAVFLHRLLSGLIDFHVDELWQRAHSKSFAAE